jgi:hypothetical protein
MPFKKGEIPKGSSPFKKGQSGNPKGRAKGTENSKTRLLRLFSLMQKKKNPFTGDMEEFTILEQMDMAQAIKAIQEGDTKAYDSLMDRFEGKPQQEIIQENISDNEIKVNIVKSSD